LKLVVLQNTGQIRKEFYIGSELLMFDEAIAAVETYRRVINEGTAEAHRK